MRSLTMFTKIDKLTSRRYNLPDAAVVARSVGLLVSTVAGLDYRQAAHKSLVAGKDTCRFDETGGGVDDIRAGRTRLLSSIKRHRTHLCVAGDREQTEYQPQKPNPTFRHPRQVNVLLLAAAVFKPPSYLGCSAPTVVKLKF